MKTHTHGDLVGAVKTALDDFGHFGLLQAEGNRYKSHRGRSMHQYFGNYPVDLGTSSFQSIQA